jgi:hypothetical protein
MAVGETWEKRFFNVCGNLKYMESNGEETGC